MTTVGLLALGLAACNKDPDGHAVAMVNGDAITRYELDLAERRLLGGILSGDEAMRRKILESLVLNRAIASAADDELDKKEQRLVEAEVQAYRDQFLAKLYLAKHAPAAPITEPAIRKYYEENPALFGGQQESRFELVAAAGGGAAEEQENLRDAVAEVAAAADWKAAAARLRARSAPLLFRTGNSREAALDPLLKSAVSGLQQPGDVRLLDVAGAPHALKLIGRETLPPKPLDEVRGQIAQSLGALALRQALVATGPKVLADSNVVYLQDP